MVFSHVFANTLFAENYDKNTTPEVTTFKKLISAKTQSS